MHQKDVDTDTSSLKIETQAVHSVWIQSRGEMGTNITATHCLPS